MNETEGLIPRPTDVIGALEYEINKGGNSATVNTMIAAREEIEKFCTLLDELREALLKKKASNTVQIVWAAYLSAKRSQSN